MKRDRLIQTAIEKINAQTYLEIGVQRGKNFFAIDAPVMIAVDPKFLIGYRRRFSNFFKYIKARFFEMTSDDFFERHAPAVFRRRLLDVALIDGLHTYEQALKDFENCLKYLSPRGIILFHDCNPLSKEAAEPGSSPGDVMSRLGTGAEWTGDVWKAIVHIRARCPNVDVFVMDCDYGVGVACRRPAQEQLPYTAAQIAAMTYSDLEKDRQTLLGLKPTQYWDEFVCTL